MGEPAPKFAVSAESAAFARSLSPFLVALENMRDATLANEVYRTLGGAAPRVGQLGRAFDELAKVVGDHMMVADLTARRIVIQTADQFVASGLALPVAAPPAVQVTGALPSVPFTDAVADMVAREPRLARGAAEVSHAYGERHAFAVARSTQIEVTKRVQKAIANTIQTGRSQSDTIASIRGIAAQAGEDMADWTHGYAETVWRTNMSTAYSAGRFREMADPAVAYAIGALRFDGPTSTPPAGDTRPNHAAAVGLIAGPNDPVWQTLAPPLGYNSFAPWTRCSGRVNAVSEAFYSGPLVEIQTREGRRLSVTVNHPVLTAERGFVPAGDVREGDHLVCHGPTVKRLAHSPRNNRRSSPLVLRRAIHNEQVIPSIEDVFRATRSDGTGSVRVERARTLPLDFDGHAALYKGDVSIYSLDWMLPDHRPGGPLKKGAVQLSGQFGPGTAIYAGHAASAASTCVQRHALLGCGSELDVALPKPAVHDIAAGADFLADLQDRNAGAVSLDDVILVNVHFYEGHVYDLQSPLGVIVAEGLVVSNCRHSLSLVSWGECRRKRLVLPDGTIRRARIPAGAHPDKRFRHGGRPDQLIYGGQI